MENEPNKNNQNNQNNQDNQNRNRPNNTGPRKNQGMMYFIVILVAFLVFFFVFNTGPKIETITYGQFTQKVEVGEVAKIDVVGNVIRIKLVDSLSKVSEEEFTKSGMADFKTTYINTELLVQFIFDYNHGLLPAQGGIAPIDIIDAQYNFAPESFLTTAYPYIMILIFGVVIFFIYRAMKGGAGGNMGFGKTKAVTGENVKVRFADVAGCDEEKEELKEIVDFLKNPRKFTRLGARIPKGVLLVGPPGTGKTLLAKAIAGESDVPFYSISGSDFVEMFVGVGAARVRDLFEQAKRNSRCLVFIDEIDAVGRQRGAGLGGGNDEREQTLNQLLVQMDGFNGHEGIIIIAATNRPDVLDPALLRAGRFDRQIVVNKPDMFAREQILQVYARKKPLDEEVDLKKIAKITTGFTGADLENLMNEAAIIAARADKSKITMNDINDAVGKVLMGPQKRSRKIEAEDNKITAYHESGHAIVTYLLEKNVSVHEVSIISRGMALGYTASRDEKDVLNLTYEQISNKIASLSAGRVAEEIVFKHISTGASQDIKVMTDYAKAMVLEYGMSKKFGMVNFGAGKEVFLGRDYQTQTNYSEKTSALIDEEIMQIISDNYERAKKLLKENIEKLHIMSKVLLEKETIYTDEIDMIMAGKSAEVVIKEMNKREETRRKAEEEAREKRQREAEEALLELKKKAQKALYEAGVLSQEENEQFLAQTKLEEEKLKQVQNLQKEIATDATELPSPEEKVVAVVEEKPKPKRAPPKADKASGNAVKSAAKPKTKKDEE